MKKILTTLSIAIMASGAFAQGTLWTLNGAGLLISTNGASIGQGTGSTFGPNSGGVGSYYFALLEDNSPTVTGGNVTGLSANPTDTSTWQFSGLYLTNLNNAAGFVSGGTAVPDSMWAPNTTNAFFVVGWSANFGNSWGAIYSALTNSVASGGNWAQEGYYGVSAVGFGEPGGGSPSLPTPHIWGTSASGQFTPIPGFTLYAVPVPEPGSFVLAGLSGLSLLLFRRRK